MRLMRPVALVLSLLAAPTTLAATTMTVVDLTPASGVRQRILDVRPAAPTASIVALPGSNGVLNITDTGAVTTSAGRCFPFTRTAQMLAEGGIAVALVDVASDGSRDRFEYVSEVVRYMQERANVPVWIAGGSSSTNPAADIASRLPVDMAVGALFFSADIPDPTMTLRVKRPSLVIYNPADVAQDAADFYAALVAAQVKDIVALDGGSAAQCGYHTFQDQEAQFTASVGNFITSHAADTHQVSTFEIDQHGVTGSWYQPATSGQGIEIEVYKDMVAPGTGYLQGSWFTFDHLASGGADHGRWYTFGGNVQSGESSALFTLYQNVGGNFNAPPVTAALPVGHVSLQFDGCTNARMAYSFIDGSGRTGIVPISRITPNVTCSAAGSSAQADFALSGNWYDPRTSGQGFVFEVNPNAPVVFFAWYTYAPNGSALGSTGQRWYTGQASYTPGARTIPLELYETTGGLFDASLPAPTTRKVGTATASFTSCTSAKLSFAFTDGSNTGQSGAIDLARVGPVPVGCKL